MYFNLALGRISNDSVVCKTCKGIVSMATNKNNTSNTLRMRLIVTSLNVAYVQIFPKESWMEGRDSCRRMGADLVSIHTYEENEFVFGRFIE